VSGTFISGTGPVGRDSAEKRAGNSNFIGGATVEVAVLVRMLAVGGDQVLPGCDQVLPGGDQVLPDVTRCDQV
jgi:hypothetical protein